MMHDTLQADRASEIVRKLGRRLDSQFDRALRRKDAINQRWYEDEQQYWGYYNSGNSKRDFISGITVDHYHIPRDNKTRPAVNIIASRISDMLFPTNDRNWSLTAPESTPKDADPEVVKRAIKGMINQIDDHLSACSYPMHGRQAIHDSVRLGCGIIKGPFVSQKTRKHFQTLHDPETGETVYVAQYNHQMRPAAKRVDPKMLFLGDGVSIDDVEHSFEVHLMNRQQVANLRRAPGFSAARLAEVIKQGASHPAALSRILHQWRNSHDDRANEWPVVEYHGPIPREAAIELGLISEDDEMSDLIIPRGEVWFCQGVVIKSTLAPLDGEEKIPYHVVNFESDELSPWGYGVPYLMRDDQYVIDMSWDAMVTNSALTSGPQIGIKKGQVTPADGNYNVRGPKLWYFSDDDEGQDIRSAIQIMNVQSSIANSQPIYENAKANAEISTGLPLFSQGESKQVHPTSSGMAMIINAANIVHRMYAHRWDDRITIPLIGRFYEWEMLHGKNADIKMDLDVEARGSSYLLVKDMQAQHAQMAYSMAAQNPHTQVKLDELEKIMLGFLDIPTDRLFLTDEELQARDQQGNPQQELEMQRAQAETQKLQIEAAKLEAEMASMQSGQPTPADVIKLQMAQIDQQTKAMEIEALIQRAIIQRDTEMAKLAANENIKMNDMQATFDLKAKDQEIKVLLEQLRLAQRERAQHSKEAMTGMKLQTEIDREAGRKVNLQRGFDSY